MITRREIALGAALAPLLMAQASPPRWRAGPPSPYPVQEIYPALHEGAIWIAGGFSGGGATERTIAFDIARGQWREGPQLPTPSHHVQLASFQGELWAIGGFMGGADRRRWICTTRVLKLAGDRWIEGPPLPKPIAEGAPIVHQGRIHIIGGRSPSGAANAQWNDQNDVADHFVFAAGASQWEAAAPLPMARNSTGAASIGGAIHVISGRTVANGVTPAHHVYDARSGRWREAAAFPEPRGGIAAATFRGRIVAGGGEIFRPGSVGGTLYTFDEASGWSRFETMPTPRHGHGFIVADDKLYAVGGAQQPSASGTLSSMDVLG